MPPRALDQLLSGGPRLSVGIITADLLRLGDELAALERAGGGIVHVDVADGVFCPLFTVGAPFVKALKTGMLIDAHLMVEEPLDKVDAFVAAGADMITMHVESTRQPHRVLQRLATATNVNDPDRGIVRGVALNPSTPVEVLEPLVDEVDYVLLLAINPGWGGQGFLPSTRRRVEAVRRLIEASGRTIALGIDGGVTRQNAAQVATFGADVIVTGSAIFDGTDAVAANFATMCDLVGAPARATAAAGAGSGSSS